MAVYRVEFDCRGEPILVEDTGPAPSHPESVAERERLIREYLAAQERYRPTRFGVPSPDVA